MMALELGGIVFVFLAVLCGVGVLLLALYFAAKLFEALLRFAVRQIRARAFDLKSARRSLEEKAADEVTPFEREYPW